MKLWKNRLTIDKGYNLRTNHHLVYFRKTRISIKRIKPGQQSAPTATKGKK